MMQPSIYTPAAMQRLAENECRIAGDLYEGPTLDQEGKDLSKVEATYLKCAFRLGEEGNDEKYRLSQSILTSLASYSKNASTKTIAALMLDKNSNEWDMDRHKTSIGWYLAAAAVAAAGIALTTRLGPIATVLGLAGSIGLHVKARSVEHRSKPEPIAFDYSSYPIFTEYFKNLPKEPPVAQGIGVKPAETGSDW